MQNVYIYPLLPSPAGEFHEFRILGTRKRRVFSTLSMQFERRELIGFQFWKIDPKQLLPSIRSFWMASPAILIYFLHPTIQTTKTTLLPKASWTFRLPCPQLWGRVVGPAHHQSKWTAIQVRRVWPNCGPPATSSIGRAGGPGLVGSRSIRSSRTAFSNYRLKINIYIIWLKVFWLTALWPGRRRMPITVTS